MQKYPHLALFSAIPFDILCAGPGESTLSSILSALIKEKLPKITERGPEWKNSLLATLINIPNIIFHNNAPTLTETRKEPFRYTFLSSSLIGSGIAYNNEQQDIVHFTTYKHADQTHTGNTTPPFPIVTGIHKIYVKVSDSCSGNCVFCSAPRDQTLPTPFSLIINAIAALKSTAKQFQCIHFSDNDFLFNHSLASSLCDEIIKEGLQDIPKTCKSRADRISPTILNKIINAGFVQLTIGVESFSNMVLLGMKKETTEFHNVLGTLCCHCNLTI